MIIKRNTQPESFSRHSNRLSVGGDWSKENSSGRKYEITYSQCFNLCGPRSGGRIFNYSSSWIENPDFPAPRKDALAAWEAENRAAWQRQEEAAWQRQDELENE